MKSNNSRFILIALTVFCVAMMGITTVRDSSFLPVRTAVGYVLMPIQSGVNIVGKSLYNLLEDRKKMATALDDNIQLKLRVDALTMENTRLKAEEYELERLRRLYEMDVEYGEYPMTGARIIAKDAGRWFKVFRIDKGENDGIRVDMNVIADGGLVGIVTDVGANYATVRSIIDDLSRVSAMSQHSGNNCIVAGDLLLYDQGRLRITDIDIASDIKEGDRIVTSNISTKFLPGLLIGYATDVSVDANRLTKSGYLIPVASFDTLQEVLIITELKNIEGSPE